VHVTDASLRDLRSRRKRRLVAELRVARSQVIASALSGIAASSRPASAPVAVLHAYSFSSTSVTPRLAAFAAAARTTSSMAARCGF
jgi:hypothetical protein